MSQKVEQQPAFVLHRRPYRETSAIIDFLTADFGRVGGVARGTRGTRRSTPFEPFVRYQISWTGRGQLRTVTGAEAVGHLALEGDRLFAGLYLNELLIRCLQPEEPFTECFLDYEAAIRSLSHLDELESILRTFERQLLRAMGYEVVFDVDAQTGESVEDGAMYNLIDGEGMCRTESSDGAAYPGAILKLIQQDNYDSIEVRRNAKRLLRHALRPHVGTKPLATRRLFAP
ncbi:MAG: DNA repair protein RecO [Gammaproteobacteria bacterium]|nr:DNA repair protein RecO [Gammaproteobacteria bacterium]